MTYECDRRTGVNIESAVVSDLDFGESQSNAEGETHSHADA